MNTRRSDHRKEHPFIRVYRAALNCFPEGYRNEYMDELIYAIRMATDDAEAHGRASLLRFAWRELRDLPLAILRAYLHKRSAKIKLQPGAYLPDGPVRNWKLAAVFLPFLLPMLYPLWILIIAKANLIANTTPFWIGGGLFATIWISLLGLLIVVWITGIARQFPIWALPALGMLFFFVYAFLQLFTQAAVFIALMNPLYGGWPKGLATQILVMILVQLVLLLILAGVVIGLLRIVPGFHMRIRQEWTLLAFLLYGIAIAPILGNDEFRGVEGYETTSLLILATGAGLYLVSHRRWQRVLALVVPAILSPAVMSLGLYQTFPAQSWANAADVSTRVWEALQPVLYLSPLPVLLLLAALAPKLPWSGGEVPASLPARNAPAGESE